MKKERMRIIAALLAGTLCLGTFGGCSSGGIAPSKADEKPSGQTVQDNDGKDAAGTENIGMTPPEDEGLSGKEGSLGSFSLEDINGETYTEKMFQDYQITMVNVFTTWCTPCINEIPDLQKLYEEMGDNGAAVAGIVLDAVDGFGNVDPEAVEKAKLLAERTKASYPFLIPDAGLLNGRLEGIDAVPETFFVDSNGNIVGQTYSGSRSYEDWKEIVETVKSGLKGADQ